MNSTGLLPQSTNTSDSTPHLSGTRHRHPSDGSSYGNAPLRDAPRNIVIRRMVHPTATLRYVIGPGTILRRASGMMIT
eukprot:9055029-Pyramimonas_sp.AAC.1